MAILSFQDTDTQNMYNAEPVKSYPAEIHKRAYVKLRTLHNTLELTSLNS